MVMISQLPIPPAARDAALETASEARDAAREVLAQGRDALHSFYSQVSCSDLSVLQIQAGDACRRPAGDMEGAVALDWRADPFVSMSDLTLVVYDGSGGGAPYHVHTLLLAHGGRKSGFVAEQVKSQQTKSKSKSKNGSRRKTHYDVRNIQRQNSGLSGTSRSSGGSGGSNAEYRVEIYVPSLAARHVPLFLDYVYGAPPRLTTATAPSLRYLSNRFDCRDLHREVTSRFIPRDLELNTAPRYCAMADELKDFEMRDRAIRIMAERFERMNVSLLRGMHPRLVRSLVQSERLECGSEALSEKVARYLRTRDEEERDSENGVGKDEGRLVPPLTDEDYYWLTHCAHMPRISPGEALFYFSYSARYPQVMDEVGSGSLKARCLAACSDASALDRLTSHLEDPDNEQMELYENLEPQMKVKLLESCLVGARKLTSEKERDFGRRNERDRDVELSEPMMYKDGEEGASKVVVLGCGVGPANGLYLQKGNGKNAADGNNMPGRPERGDVVYEKEAVWRRRRVTFLLRPAPSGRYYAQYKLAVREGGDGRGRALYNSPTVAATGEETLPERGWEVEDDAAEGLHPPPQFVGRVQTSDPTWNRDSKRSV